MSDNTLNRRQFIKTTAVALAAIPLLSTARTVFAAAKGGKAESLPAGATAVPATDAVATALGYKANAKDFDFKTHPNLKKGTKDMNCKSCALYTASNGSWGKCQMITAGLVSAGGLCGSWSKKA